MIFHVMRHCRDAGIKRFIINTHHLPGLFESTFPNGEWEGLPVHLVHEFLRLETGAGLKNIEPLLDKAESLLIYNSDILTDLPLDELIRTHRDFGRPVATLAASRNGPAQHLVVDLMGRLLKVDRDSALGDEMRFQFLGIAVVESRLMDFLQKDEPESVVEGWRRALADCPGAIRVAEVTKGKWQDIGTIEAYEASREIGFSSAALLLERPLGPENPAASLTKEEAARVDSTAYEDDPGPVRVETVPAGASGRRFFRILRPNRTRILMAYPPTPAENGLFAPIGRALRDACVPVPRILRDDPSKGLIWLEDLGDKDLFSMRDSPGQRRSFYRKAIDELLHIQSLSQTVFFEAETETLPAFDADLYLFERQYFLKELVARVDSDWKPYPELEEEGDHLSRILLENHQSWVHRDYQSKNLMIDAKEEIRIVDYQGIRLGNCFYDLGSLLFDPYVGLPREEREDHYCYYCRRSEKDPKEVRSAYLSASAQRLMQALGAFGRFGIGGEVAFFREKIPEALRLLREVLEEAGFLEMERLVVGLQKRIGD